MEPVIAQGIQLLLPYQNLQRIAFEILWNYHQNITKVASLQVLSLKIIMKKKWKKRNQKAKLFYRLLFKEPQGYWKFADRIPFRNIFERFALWIQDNFTSYPEKRKPYLEFRTNPHIMFAILDNYLTKDGRMGSITIEIEKTIMKVHGLCYDSVAEIPHRTGIDYDTHWADAFARLAFAKSVYFITLRFTGEHSTTFDSIFDLATNWVDSLKPTIPDEGWKEAIENGKQAVYCKHTPNVLIAEKLYVQGFYRERIYCPIKRYWGSLG